MGIFDSVSKLFQPKKTNTKQGKELKAAQTQVAGTIGPILNKPFVPYTGDFTAPMNETQNDATSRLQALLDKGGPGQLIDNYKQYFDPYLAAQYDAVDQNTQQQMRDWTAEINKAGGAFGTDTGWGVGSAVLADQAGRSKAQLASDAFQKALGWSGQDITNQMNANTQQANEINSLFTQGTQGQATEQHNLDALLNEFMRQDTDYERKAQLAAQIFAALQNGQQQGSKPSVASQILGPIATVAGAGLKAYAGA